MPTEPTPRPLPPPVSRSVVVPRDASSPPRLTVTGPPGAVPPNGAFTVQVRVLNTSVIVERFVVEVVTSPATAVDHPRSELTLLPQQDGTLEFTVAAPDAEAAGTAGAPWQLDVAVRVRGQSGETEVLGRVRVMVLAQPRATEPRRPGLVEAPPPDTYHLLADHPIEREGDLLDADATARRIADVILDTQVVTPFTLGIQGGWGAGKSSLMQLVRRHLEARGRRRVRVAWFNAWTAEGSDALATLLRSVLRELDRNVLRRVIRKTNATSWLRLPFMVFGSWLGARTLADEVWRLFALDAPQRNVIRTEIQRALGDWAGRDRKLRTGRLLVVFVDDLDRCSAENVARVLEAIRLYLDAPGLVFVIGYDPDVVGEALATARGDKARGPAYLEKIIQVDHTVGAPEPAHARELARLCARHCGVEQLLGEAELALIVERSQRNPRRVKRFLNTFVLAHQLDSGSARLWPDEHIKLLLLRLYFPAFFRLLVTEPQQDVIRQLIELARLRTALLARREPGAEDVAWLCETTGLANGDPADVLAGLEQHLPEPIVELSKNRDLFTLLWSFGDHDRRANLLERLRDPAALRAIEVPEPAIEPALSSSAPPSSAASRPDKVCAQCGTSSNLDFCPDCGAYLDF
ncbi:P-loop NTPase fold protein [Amycolatopsis sp. NPDC004747]